MTDHAALVNEVTMRVPKGETIDSGDIAIAQALMLCTDIDIIASGVEDEDHDWFTLRPSKVAT